MVDGETQADWIPPYLPPPPGDSVAVQTGQEVQATEQQCDEILALPEGVSIDAIMTVVSNAEALRKEQCLIHFYRCCVLF